MNGPEFTDDQICDAIADCIKAHDFKRVASLMQLLALQAPRKAEALLGYIQLLSATASSEGELTWRTDMNSELPGMWEEADFIGGATDQPEPSPPVPSSEGEPT